jgi:hypothetical protein
MKNIYDIYNNKVNSREEARKTIIASIINVVKEMALFINKDDNRKESEPR